MLKNFLKNVPIPICGLILGLSSLGNLIKVYGYITIGNILGGCAFILLILVLAKIILTFSHTKKSLTDPIVASVSPTFTMAIMVLSTYIFQNPSFQEIAKLIWFIAIIMQYLLMIFFIYNFLIRPSVEIEHLYPSWFIIFVGIGVIAVTSSNYFPLIGKINFWIGLFFYCLLLPLIIYRVFHIKNMPVATFPLVTIIAAPGSLELTGYLNSFNNYNIDLVLVLLTISQVLYWFIILQMIRLFILAHVKKLFHFPFYPSYAAFTFPLVISATAITTVANKFHSELYNVYIILGVAKFETLVAFVICLYVLYKYAHYLISSTFIEIK